MNNLLGLKLTLVSITRQSVIDATFVTSCDNCGKTIVNIAEVQDENGKTYNIGLDCKATLFNEDKDKKKKSERRYAEKFLNLISKEEIQVEYIWQDQSLTLWNTKVKNEYGGDTLEMMETVSYLLHVGIKKEFIEQVIKLKPYK